MNDTKPGLGDEVEATVQLKNSDSQAIEIPWSTDDRIMKQGQEPEHMEWQGATFEFMLRDHEDTKVRLRSLTAWLHGSKHVPNSELTIQPGQYVSAMVKFKIEDLYPIDLRLKEGQWQLSAEWVQVGRTWSVKDCKASNGFFHYDRYYLQQNPPLTIEVTAPPSGEHSTPKAR